MDEKGRRSVPVVSIGSVLENVLKSVRSDDDVGLMNVWRLWDRTVGEAIARNTKPAAFKGRLLLVHVSSSAWIHQLQFLKADLIRSLNTALGKDLVEDVKFKIGPV